MDLFNDRNDFILKNKGFIYNVASSVCGKKLDWHNDDELSIAMIAFNKAIDSYTRDKGNFYTYARILIKNALIDYFRSNTKIPYLSFDLNNQLFEKEASTDNFDLMQENLIRAEEIKSFSQELGQFKLDLQILVSSSPSHKDTRDELLNVVFAVLRNEEILNDIYTKKQLPVKKVSLLTGKKEKFLEKWRRYLLSLIILMANDNYLYLKSFLNLKAGENREK